MAFGYQLVVVNLCRTATFPPQAWKTALNLARECGVNLSELCSVFQMIRGFGRARCPNARRRERVPPRLRWAELAVVSRVPLPAR
jgi:hypothetical protein